VNYDDPEGRQPRPNVARYTPNVQVRDVGTLIQYQIARNAFEKLQRVDPFARPDYHIGRASAQYYAQQAAFYTSARQARQILGYGSGGKSPVGQTFAGGQIQSLLENAIPRSSSNGGGSGGITGQFTSQGSGLAALQSVVGNNYSRQTNGSYTARDISVGNGFTATLNLHTGSGNNRSGNVQVLEGTISSGQQVGTRFQSSFRFKIEYAE
jgi:hypothetical protein